MKTRALMTGLFAATAMFALTACDHSGSSRPGDPAGTSAERAYDRAAGTNTSGAYPSQSDGTRANPPGTEAQRAYDRAAGTNTSGAYPRQSDCTKNNPPGTMVSRELGTTDASDCKK